MLPIKITIPQYIRQVQTSKKQIPSYYEWNGSTIKGKKKKLLQQFVKRGFGYNNCINILPEYLLDDYCIGVFDNNKLVSTCSNLGEIINMYNPKTTNKYIVINKKTKEKIIANKSQIGKPKFQLISGQDIFSGNLREHLKGTIFQAIKQSFVPYVKDMPIISNYPVRIKMYIYDTVKNFNDTTLKDERGRRWDLGNRAYPYGKAFLDLLVTGTDGTNKVMEPKLIDDDRLHVTEDPQGGVFCPLRTNDDSRRKLVFVIEEDKRKIIKNNQYYNGKYENDKLLINLIDSKSLKGAKKLIKNSQQKIQFIEGLGYDFDLKAKKGIQINKTKEQFPTHDKDFFDETRGESNETEDNLL